MMPFIDLNGNCLYAHKPVKEEIRRNLENTLSNNFTQIDISANVAETPQNYLGKFKPITKKQKSAFVIIGMFCLTDLDILIFTPIFLNHPDKQVMFTKN